MHNGPHSKNTGKAKDFKGSIIRLMKELKSFKVLIMVALILAALGSVLSILAPDQLSNLTDEISKGLIINTDNLKEFSSSLSSAMSEEKMASVLPQIISLDLSENKIVEIMKNPNISQEEKNEFQNTLTKLKSADKEEYFKILNEIPENILNELLVDSEYQSIKISKQDKIEFLKVSAKKENKNIPVSILSTFLSDLTIDGISISKEDQLVALEKMSSLNENISSEELYQKIEEMPESIQNLVKPFMDIEAILMIVYILIAFYLLSALFTYIESISMTNVANNFARNLRRKISTKINTLPLKFFDKHQSGDILSRVTNDVDTIAQSLNQSLSTLVSAITLFLGTIIMMFVTNWVMALTAIFSSLFGFIFMFGVLGKSQKYFVKRQEELGNLNSHIEEIYSGLNVVKAYNGQNLANQEFDELNEKVYECNRKSQFLSGLMMPMMNFIGNFGYVAVCIVGALLTLKGYISFGVIVAFISYVRLFTSPLSQIAQAMTSLQSVSAASERVFEFLDEEEMDNQKDIHIELKKEEVKGNIEFKNVLFQYDGNETPTIHDFSAKASAGQKIAIVGPTGAGKTTMVNLLMKFYELNGGDIFIDGISTKHLTRENIHSLFTMVLQDTWLFEGTVKENIVYNRKNVSDERVKEVCKTVGLDHFIRTMPDGYDSEITDIDSVSSGQRQLMTIARGMIEDAPFLILDEATSNVDTRTEELVQKAMDKLTEGKTSFIIAHRLSTIKNADLILVMKDGNIIETGSHDELMDKNGFYADLYNSQFEL